MLYAHDRCLTVKATGIAARPKTTQIMVILLKKKKEGKKTKKK